MKPAVAFLMALSFSLLIALGCSSQAQAPTGNMSNGSASIQPPTQLPVANASEPTPPGNQNSSSLPPGGISSSELAKHSDVNSCWVLFDGTVYDMTDYLNAHPGGAEVILPTCGKPDSSFATAFGGQHGSKYSDALASVAPVQGKFAG
jgi:cytochrome b involved in lipid metabolism